MLSNASPTSALGTGYRSAFACLEIPQALTKLASPIATGKDISAYSMGFADIIYWAPAGKIPDGVNL